MMPAPRAELRLRSESGVPVVNCRDVAELFEKRHADVLRDIERISTNADLRSLKSFRPVSYIDPKGEFRPSYDLTRDGFTLLVMRWTGEKGGYFSTRPY